MRAGLTGPVLRTLPAFDSTARASAGWGSLANSGNVSPELSTALQRKGYILSKHPRVRREQTRPGPAGQQFGERFHVEGLHRLGIAPGPGTGPRACGIESQEYWTLSQVVSPAFVEQAGQKFMDAYPKPVGRNSTAEEQGWPLAFLNSDAASYITGTNLCVDGGMTSTFATNP